MLRRAFLSTMMIVLLSFSAFAGGQEEAGQAGEAGGAEAIMKQAPQLAEMVDAGELPPLEERLPENPLVVEPLDSLGSYGGTVYPGKIGNARNPQSEDLVTLLIWNTEHTELSPHFAADFEANDDFTEFEITLRRGVKWSDGDDFNVDDIMFYYEVVTTPEVFPQGLSGWMVSEDDTPAEFTKVDDHTFRVAFNGPKPAFPRALAEFSSFRLLRTPKHYLSQFHPNYVDLEDLEELVDEEGYGSVAELFEAKWNDWYDSNTERPTLGSHMLVQGAPSDPVILERNPYFWAVDTEGRQLPYIDQMVFNVAGDQEVLNLRILSGDVDITRHTVAGEIPLYMQNRQDGEYSVNMWTNTVGSTDLLMFNLSHPDPQKRELFGDARFRRAMSHAVNREQINELVYQGLAGEPSQFAPAEDSLYYNPELSNSYVEYDPERAEELLDEMGLPVDDEGFRAFPNGDRLQVNITAATEQRNIGPVAELWLDYMNAVGVRANLRSLDKAAFMDNMRSNDEDYDAGVWWGDPFYDLQFDTNRTLTPEAEWSSMWAPAYARWNRTGGEEGVEPPEIHKRTYELSKRLEVQTDQERAVEIAQELTDIAAENVWTIGTLNPPKQPIIVSNRLRNVVETGVFQWFSFSRVHRAYQWYIEE